MLRTILAAGAFALVIAQPAIAQEGNMKCDEATMMSVQKDIDAATDAMMKENAMKEMNMAKESDKMKEMDKCAMHLGNAMKAAKGM